MGVYVYNLTAKKHMAVLPNGTEVVVHELRYLYKPSWSNDESPYWKMRMAAVVKYWESRNLPEYVMVCHDEGPKQGYCVYSWKSESPFWYDTADPGVKVGEVNDIRGKGKKERLVVGDHICRVGTSYDAETGQSICMGCLKRIGPPCIERTSNYQQKKRLEEEARVREAAHQQEVEADRREWPLSVD